MRGTVNTDRIRNESHVVCSGKSLNVALPFMLKFHVSMWRRPTNDSACTGKTTTIQEYTHCTLVTPQHTIHISITRSASCFTPRFRHPLTELYNLCFLFCFPISDIVVVSRIVLNCLQVILDQVVRTRHLLSCETLLFACMQYQDQAIHYSGKRFVALDFKLDAI